MVLEKTKSKLENFAMKFNKSELSDILFIGYVGANSTISQISSNPTAQGIVSGILYGAIGIIPLVYHTYSSIKKK